MTVSGGDLPGTYVLAQFHFHWGSETSGGSEHLVDGERHFAEVHLVHYKQEHGSVAVAAGFDDGLAVLAFFVDVDDSQCDPDALDNLLNDHIDDNVGGVGETIQFEYTVSSLNPSSLTTDDYYR